MKKVFFFIITVSFACVFIGNISLATHEQESRREIVEETFWLAQQGKALESGNLGIGSKREEIAQHWGQGTRYPYNMDDFYCSSYYPHKKIAIEYDDDNEDNEDPIGEITQLQSISDRYRNLTPEDVKRVRVPDNENTTNEFNNSILLYNLGTNRLYFFFPNGTDDSDPATPYIFLSKHPYFPITNTENMARLTSYRPPR